MSATRRKYVAILIFALGGFALALALAFPQEPILPTVDAGLGPCAVDFTVTSHVHKPLYAAVIHAKFKYGFWGFRNMDLLIYTNTDGRARVAGLPAKLRDPPLTFTITYKNVQKEWNWTGLTCYEQPTIVLNAM